MTRPSILSSPLPLSIPTFTDDCIVLILILAVAVLLIICVYVFFFETFLSTIFLPSKNKNNDQNQNRRKRQNHYNHDHVVTMMTMNKLEFLSRVGDDYGYRHNTDLGYIDDWRPKEFPSLIYPIRIAGGERKRKDCNYYNYNDDDDEEENDNHNENDNNNDNEREVYLDYAGSALPMKSQLEHTQSKMMMILANPHSTGPAASRTLECIKRAEKCVLTHLGAAPGRYASLQLPDSFYNNNNNNNTQQRQIMDRHPGYEVLFTSGATEAFKTIAERFPWKRLRRRRSSNSSSGCCFRCRQQQQQQKSSSSSSIFMYVTNSHNSVVGMRQLAIQQGATFYCIDMKELEEMTDVKDWKTLEEKISLSSLSSSSSSSSSSSREGNHVDDDGVVSGFDCCWHCNETTTTSNRHNYNLLVFPSECNFSGDRPSDTKSIISIARESGWYSMLDIAKHASTDRVNLKDLNPDFAALSFYKLFGSPTGVGALLVRRSAIPILFEEEDNETIEAATMSETAIRNHNNNNNNNNNSGNKQRYYQGGGSVDIMLPNRDYTVPKSRYIGLASMTSGTSNFRGIANLVHGFDTLEQLGGMSMIHRHACCIAKELTRRLRLLKHNNGMSVVRIYGAWGNSNKNNSSNDEENDTNSRGPTVALNLFRSDGSAVGYNEVSKLASLNHPPMQFRTGCFCNPGACQKALTLDDQQAIDNYEKTGHVCGDHIDLANGMPTGAIRVSFGKDSIWEDMDVFVRFLDMRFTNNYSDDDTAATTATATATAYTVPTSNTDDDTISKKKTIVHVSELYLFPIKSCAAQHVPKWPLDLYSGGKLKYDREFAIVDTSGTALRLQTYSKIGLICPIVDPDTDTMTVSAPGCNDLVIRLSDDLYHGGDNVVRVCGNKCGARVWGDDFVSEWFTSFLGIQCWLARYSSSLESPTDNNSFSNEQPILLISENAVAALNDVLESQRQQPVGSIRFRPNIVIKGVEDNTSRHHRHHLHIEDEWKTISLPNGRLNFSVEGSCPRCTMVDYDPKTGKRGKTFRALATYRRRNGQIVFGIFLRTATTPSIYNSPVTTNDDDDDGNNNNNHSSQNLIVWIHEGDALECR
jgi:molybdenum cofactor sulfurtransferase